MSLTKRERLIFHLGRLVEWDFDNLDIEIATAVNYIINYRAKSLPREDVIDMMKSAPKEVKASDKLYMKMGLR